MPKTRPPYAPEFPQQMVESVRAGRSAEERWLMSAVGLPSDFVGKELLLLRCGYV